MRKQKIILTEAQKLEIKRRYITENIRQIDLAIEYNIDIRTIRRIVHGNRRYAEKYSITISIPQYTEKEKIAGKAIHVGGKQLFTDIHKTYTFYEKDDFWTQGNVHYHEDNTIQGYSPGKSQPRYKFKRDYEGNYGD